MQQNKVIKTKQWTVASCQCHRRQKSTVCNGHTSNAHIPTAAQWLNVLKISTASRPLLKEQCQISNVQLF